MEGTPIRIAAAFARTAAATCGEKVGGGGAVVGACMQGRHRAARTAAATSAAKVRGHLGRPGHARDGARRGAGLPNGFTRQEGDVEDAVAQVPPDEVRNRGSACNEGRHQ